MLKKRFKIGVSPEQHRIMMHNSNVFSANRDFQMTTTSTLHPAADLINQLKSLESPCGRLWSECEQLGLDIDGDIVTLLDVEGYPSNQKLSRSDALYVLSRSSNTADLTMRGWDRYITCRD